MTYTYTLFAATYNCGSYGAGSFGSNASCNTSTSTSSPSGAGGLASTGQSILLPITAGVVLIAVAIALLIHTLRRRKK